jgi:MFS family permease
VKHRVAITLVFFVNGAMFASWASRIPALSDNVGATTGGLSLALLAPAVGAVITMPLVGRLLPGRSSRTFCRCATVALAIALPLPGLARSVPTLALALLAVGITNAVLDLAMNAQGVTVERELGQPILSSLHAAFSLGGFAGAGLGALAADLGVDPLVHLAIAAGLFGLVGLVATSQLIAPDHDLARRAPAARSRYRPSRRLLLLGAACLFCFLAEGGASDWSAKLVHSSLGGTAALGAIAYAAFSIAMACGRMTADRLWKRWGAAGLLRRGGALAAVGLTAGLAIGTVESAIAGFIALGLGLAGVVPTLFRSASEEPGVATGPSLAVVSGLGYAGFLAGPPIIGGIAQLTTLRLACGLLALAGVVVTVLATSARPAGRAVVRARAVA